MYILMLAFLIKKIKIIVFNGFFLTINNDLIIFIDDKVIFILNIMFDSI